MKSGIESLPEEALVKQHDISLLKRFLPLLKTNYLMISASMVLMLALSLFDLAVPYVTKTAVDRYILPAANPAQGHGASHGNKTVQTERIYSFRMEESSLDGLSDKSRALFKIDRDGLMISHSDMGKLSREETLGFRQEDINGAITAGFILVAIALARFVFSFVQIILMEFAGQKMMHGLRLTIYRHIQTLSVDFFTKNTVGRLSTRVTNDIQNMQEMFTTIITFVMKDAFTLAGIIGILAWMDLKLSLAVFTIIPVVVLFTIGFSRQSRLLFRVLRVKVAELNTMFSECIGGIKVTQLFCREKKMMTDFNRLNHDYFLAGMSQIKVYGLFMPIIDVLGSTALAIVIFYGGGRAVSNIISLGTLIAFISYTKMFFRPLRDIAEKHNILQDALASGERITQILDRKPEDKGGLEALETIDTLAFDRVCFSYQPEEPVLTDVSFTLAKGESLAIVGPTGSGKTSLINLIVKFYKQEKGSIRINGRAIEDFSTRSVRSRIAIVSQDPYLFSGTVRDNILPQGKTATEKELEQIIDLSNLSTVIDNLPKGIETRISQGGSSLSSGERQLISIARAFAHSPDLIIFDEATSYVDTESEENIRLAMARLRENRTAITIAHRLRSAVTSDRIMVLKDGRVVESGDHAALMENRKFYYHLHAADR